MISRFHLIPERHRRTDGKTDRQTDRQNCYIRNNFFGMRIVNLWNSLSDTVATAPSVNCFKGRFDRQNAGNRFSMEWVNGEDRGETTKSSL